MKGNGKNEDQHQRKPEFRNTAEQRADLAKEAQKAKDAALQAKIDAGIKEGIAKYIAEHGVADAEPDKNDTTEKAGKNNK